MKHCLAQLNLAQFRLPQPHPVNADFMNNLDAVNARAEASPGFVWRHLDEGPGPSAEALFGHPHIIANLSMWRDMAALFEFTYRDPSHTRMMRRRKEWFDKIHVHMVLWWVEETARPSLSEAKARLDGLRQEGPSPWAFTFKRPFAAPGGQGLDARSEPCG